MVERNLAKVEVAGPSPVFRSKVTGSAILVLPVALYLVADGFVRATSRRPFQGSGVSATIRGITQAQRECESRFPLQRAEAKRFKGKAKAFYISDLKCYLPVPSPTPVGARDRNHFRPSS